MRLTMGGRSIINNTQKKEAEPGNFKFNLFVWNASQNIDNQFQKWFSDSFFFDHFCLNITFYKTFGPEKIWKQINCKFNVWMKKFFTLPQMSSPWLKFMSLFVKNLIFQNCLDPKFFFIEIFVWSLDASWMKKYKPCPASSS